MANKFQPYVGPRPFERKDQAIFFGRTREANDLFSLVVAHGEVLFYAQSGAGKTSLLNARLHPQLEKKGFKVLPLARVGGRVPENINLQDIKNIYTFNTLMSMTTDVTDIKRFLEKSLVDHLEEQKHHSNNSPYVIIFDQFEELFSSYQQRWEDRKEFFAQIGKALEDDRLLRVIFVIREDYIAQIDPYAPFLPEKLRTRFRLERLREEAALLAITGPLKNTQRYFEDGVAEKLVKDLRKIRAETGADKVEEVIGEFVEPVQLQVVCESLWQDLLPDITSITEAHLKNFGDVDQTLSRFYEKSINEAAQRAEIKEGDLRVWFEQNLITPIGTRGTIHRGREKTGDIPNAAVDILENCHIIRGELRGGAKWYELSHDRFIEPILKSDQIWLPEWREAERSRQRLKIKVTEWIRQGKGESGLLDEIELRETERWLKIFDTSNLSYDEEILQLVQNSKTNIKKINQEKETARQHELQQAQKMAELQKQRADEQVKVAKRRLWVMIASVVVAFGVGSLTIYAFTQKRRAEAEEQKAKKQEMTAFAERESAIIERNRADSLKNITLIEKQAAIAERNRAEHLSAEMNAARSLAEKREQDAQKARDEAKLLAEKEKKARAQSDSLSIANLDRALALHTIQQLQLNQVERAALLARQSYIFYQQSKSGFLDVVYDALRKALNRLDGSGGPKILNGHHDWVTAVAFNQSGSIIASGSADSTIRLWNLQSNKSDSTILRGHTAKIRTLAFSRDGEILASGSDDRTVRLWKLSSPDSAPIILKDHTGSIGSLAFSLGSQTLISGSADSTVRMWNLRKFTAGSTILYKHRGAVRAVAISANDQWLATCSTDSTVYLWKFRGFSAVPSRLLRHESDIKCLAFSPSGKLLASGYDNGSVLLWNLDRPDAKPQQLLGHEKYVTSLAFSPDGQMLVSGSADNSIRLWNVYNTETDRIVLREHKGLVWSVAFSPDGKALVSGGSDKTIRVWITSAEILAEGICKKVKRNLTSEEWREFVGSNIPYKPTCPKLTDF